MNNKQIYFLFTQAYIPIQTAVPVNFSYILIALKGSSKVYSLGFLPWP